MEETRPSERMLAPLENLKETPLVGLEKAVKPLVETVKNICNIVSNLKRRCSTPKDGLTVDESAAIMLYTYEADVHEDSPYYVLNSSLRSEEPIKIEPWSLYIKLLENGLEKLPDQPGNYYRGIRGHYSDDYKTGRVFTWWAFTSCTSRLDVLENDSFLGKKGMRTLFSLHCKTGKDIKNHSCMPIENEVLIVPNTQFRVNSCLPQEGGLYMIQIEEISSPLSTHSIEPGILDSSRTLLVSFAFLNSVYCRIHPKKTIEHWCHDDKQLVCGRCLIEQHKNHQHVSVDEFAESKSKQVM